MDCNLDVAVLGGGAAGAAAALVLLKYSDLSVGVIEKSEYENFRIGESLSPGVKPLLNYLGVDDLLKQHQPSFGLRAAWGNDKMQSLDFIYTLQGQGLSLNRQQFDRTLAETVVAHGGILLKGAKLKYLNSTPQGWEITTSKGNWRSRYCIDATGKGSVLARHQGARRLLYDRLVGVVGIGEMGGEDSFTEIEACEDGWWYSAKLPDYRTVFAYLSDSDLIKRDRLKDSANWLSKLNKTRHLVKRAQKCQFKRPVHLFPAHTAHLDRMYGNNWIAVGDAVASHDPLSARGIPNALNTGIQAARIAHGLLSQQTNFLEGYSATIVRDFQEYLDTRTRYYQIEERWKQSPFWHRRQSVIQLNPMSHLAAIKEFRPLNLHLNQQDYKALYLLCIQSQPAHKIIRAFKETVKTNVPDRQIILGLQDLVSQDIVKVL